MAADKGDQLTTVEDVETFMDWLGKPPPYELVGRIVCGAAIIESALARVAEQAGVDTSKLQGMPTAEVLREVRKRPHPDELVDEALLERIQGLLKIRNVLAHGAPYNRFGYGAHGFAKRQKKREGDGYDWWGFEEGELEAAGRELGEIGDMLTSVALEFADRTAVPPD